MLDMIVAVLTLCFVIGVIGSALFVATFYLYRESHRGSPKNDDKAAAPAPAARISAAAGIASGDARAPRPLEARGAVAAACDKESTGSTSISCSCSNNSDCASSSSYTCQVCGSCCPGENNPEVLRHGQGDHHHKQHRPHYRCGEVFVSGVDVGFKCHSFGGDGCSTLGGTFFFYRGRHPGELHEPIAPSDRYMTMAALPSVPYHLWFCHTEHTAKSRRCPNCRRVFSFEICDSEMIFHTHGHRRRHQPGDTEDDRQLRGVWLLVCEEADGRSSVVYRGDVCNVTSLHYTGKLLIHFGLPDKQDRRLRRAASSSGLGVEKMEEDVGVTTTAEADGNVDKYSAQGDLRIRAGLELNSGLTDSSRQRKQPHQLRQLQHLPGGHRARRRHGSRDENDDDGDQDSNVAGIASDSEPDLNSSTTNSEIIQSPMSMGSMRKAAKWPITQIESLIESSSSDERQTAAATEAVAKIRTRTEQLPLANVSAVGCVGGDNVSIQLDIAGKASLDEKCSSN